MMDKDFELQGEAAERPKPKKLTAADIPEGCLCAAVDSTGCAFGYDAWVYPGHYDWHARIGGDYNEVLIGENFDASDWQNSLVSRETAEQNPELKKLTAADIPEGYCWGAINKDQEAWAFKVKPTINDNNEFWEGEDPEPILFLGNGYDSTNWENSLIWSGTDWEGNPLQIKPHKQLKLKKLTVGDIPEGYNYAAVDEDQNAYAFKNRPVLFEVEGTWKYIDETEFLHRIGNRDATDWQNSLVFRETAERPQLEAIKDQQDKPSFLEIDPNFLEAMAWRMTANKGKYPVNNWKGLTDRFTILDAIYRHANDIKRMLEGEESLTGETIQKHCAAIACNAQFLFYHSPENQWERAARSRQSNAKEI